MVNSNFTAWLIITSLLITSSVRANEKIIQQEKMSFEKGIDHTIDWYLENENHLLTLASKYS